MAAEHFKTWLVQTAMCMYVKNTHQVQSSVRLIEKQESNISKNGYTDQPFTYFGYAGLSKSIHTVLTN